MKTLARLIGVILTLGMCATTFALAASIIGPQIAEIATAGEWDTREVNLDETSVRSLVYDSEGQLMAAWFQEDRAPVSLEDIPDVVIEAILATEDESFYSHKGINLRAIGRALVSNVDSGGISQGGSTITQQLIKNLVLNDEQTVERKVQEAALAYRLEQQMSKDEILEEYLNTVYFGAGAYGVRAAAEVYFGLETPSNDPALIRSALSRMDWADAAMLAALISNPSAHDPFQNRELAERQQEIVLNRLAELGKITEDEALRFSTKALPIEPSPLSTPPEDFFTAEVRRQLLEDDHFLGGGYSSRNDLILGGGLRITTSFDPNVQDMAERARKNMRDRYGIPESLTLAIASVDPATGAVKAMVGGEDFREDKFNLATQGKRQPGSSFKTFVLTTAIKSGLTTEDKVNGKGPCIFRGLGEGGTNYEAENFGNSPGRIDSIRNLTLSSSNCGYLRLGQLVGNNQVIATAKSMGIRSPLFEVASLPLGVWEVTPMEMASAYGTLASGGNRTEPYFIERIEDYNGNLIYDRRTDNRYQPQLALDENVACLVTDVLHSNTISGTGAPVRSAMPWQPAAGKTGTTENFEDAWFVGYTPYLATAVWIGNPDERQRMVVAGTEVTGGFIPAEAWGMFNAEYHQNLEPQAFPVCGPQAKAEYKRLPGDPDLSGPCADGAFALDYGSNGTVDNCAPNIPGGFFPCPYETNFFDSTGNPVTVYCGELVVEPEPEEEEDDDGGLDDGSNPRGDGGGDDSIDGGGGPDGGGDDGGNPPPPPADDGNPPPADDGGGGDGGVDGGNPPPADDGGGGDGGDGGGDGADAATDAGL